MFKIYHIYILLEDRPQEIGVRRRLLLVISHFQNLLIVYVDYRKFQLVDKTQVHNEPDYELLQRR